MTLSIIIELLQALLLQVKYIAYEKPILAVASRFISCYDSQVAGLWCSGPHCLTLNRKLYQPLYVLHASAAEVACLSRSHPQHEYELVCVNAQRLNSKPVSRCLPTLQIYVQNTVLY